MADKEKSYFIDLTSKGKSKSKSQSQSKIK